MEPLDQESFYDGTHWTSWSQNYGCPNSNPSPFGLDGTASVRSFCRARGLKDLDKKPESFQFRFCTLPDLITDQDNQPTWVYADATVTTNQYPTADKKIKSKANKAHAEFSARLKTWQSRLADQGADAFLEEGDDFSQTAGPAGENEGLTEFSQLFVNLERQSIWVDPVEFTSSRPACDPRLEESAKKCFTDAFNENGDFLGNNFCTHIPNFPGYALNDVQLRKEINLMNCLFDPLKRKKLYSILFKRSKKDQYL